MKVSRPQFALLRRLLVVSMVAVLTLATVSFAAAQDDNAMVRVIHASPDAPAVDVWVDGAPAIQGLAFPEGTDYVELPAGDHQVQVVPAGGAVEDAVIDATLTLTGGAAYTVAAVGLVADITAQVFEDNLAAPADGQAHVRVIHASPDAPAVDIAVTDGPVLIENLAFPDASDYTPVPAGSYDLEVRPTGTEDVALEIPGFAAEAGMIYDVVAVGTLADGTLAVAPFVAEPMAMDASTDDATGTGGGNPTAPATGAGGTSADTTNWAIFGALAALIVAATGGLTFATRRARN
jgi:hypothetical protein